MLEVHRVLITEDSFKALAIGRVRVHHPGQQLDLRSVWCYNPNVMSSKLLKYHFVLVNIQAKGVKNTPCY
jgi:hypothetical protein